MDSIQVSIKIRPLIQREKEAKLSSLWSVCNGNTIKSNNNEYELSFDHILDENANTQQLFNTAGKRIVSSALKGINGTIFAYGQTSSGKTYSMLGNNDEPGIVTLVVREIFKEIEASEDREFLLRIGYVEIYNEKIFDLLDKDKDDLKIHETQYGEINIQQREVMAKSEKEILGHFDLGNKNKRMGETGMNEQSSRSHTIFRITIESREQGKNSEESSVQISNLNLVDLAGSERASQTKATGNRAKEGAFINKSLLFLSLVIQKLSESSESTGNEKNYINYRDSKLTRILQASLGGNALTSIICTITPAALDETYYTLTFAQRAKKIKNKPKVNQVLTDQVMMKKLEKEISRLRMQLISEQSKNSVCQTIDIEKKIADRVNQFLHSHNVNNFASSSRTDDHCRRRTWCPTSTIPVKVSSIPTIIMAPPALPSSVPLRRTTSSKLLISNNEWLDDEQFSPAEEFNLDRTLSPLGSKDDLNLLNLIRTPRSMRPRRSSLESPNLKLIGTTENLKARCDYLQLELEELNDFKKLETQICDDCCKMELKLRNANEQLTRLECENEEIQISSTAKDVNLATTINELKLNLTEAENKKIVAMKELENSQSIQNSLQYEFDLVKTRAKEREMELIRSLDEARDETKTAVLNEKVTTLTTQLTAAETAHFKLLQKYDALFAQSNSPKSPEIMLNETLVDPNVAILTKRIEELEELLNSAQKEVLSTQTTLKEKSSDALQIQKESDELSTQLIDSLEEIDACRVTIKNLEENLSKVNTNSSETMMQLEKQLADMKSQKDNCADKMEEMEFELINAQEKNASLVKLEQKLADIESEKHNCSMKMEELELELISVKEKNASLIKLEQELIDMKSEKDKYTEKMEEMEHELVVVKEKNASLVQLEQELIDLKCGKDNSSIRMEELELELISLKEKNAIFVKLEPELTDLKCEKDNSSVRVEELELELISLKVKTASLIQLEQQLADMKSEKVTCSVKMDELELELISLKEKNASLEHDLTDLKCGKDNSSVRVEELELELISLREKNATLIPLEQQLADMKREKETCSVKMEELEFELISLKEENSSLIQFEQQLTVMKSEKETCSMKMEEMVIVKENNVSLIQLEQQLADMKSEKESCTVKMEELEHELVIVKEKNIILDKLEQELTDMKSEKGTCTEKIKELEFELISVKEKNEDLMEKSKMLQSQSDRLRLELESLISEDKTTNTDFQNELVSTTQQNSELKKKIEDLEIEFDEKILKIKVLEDAMCAQEHEMTTEIADLKKGLTGLITMEEENIRLKNVEKQHKKCGKKLEELQEKVLLNEAVEMELQSKYDQIHELESTLKENENKIDELKSKLSTNQEESTSGVVVSLQQQLNDLHIEKMAADVRVYELEEEISKLTEDYQKKIEQIKREQEESLTSANNALLENDKLRMELSNVIEAHQNLLEIESKKYTQLVTETDEERLKSIEEIDEIVVKLNSTKCSLDDAKKAAIQRDLKLTELELQMTTLQQSIMDRDELINNLEAANKLRESEAQTVDVNLVNDQNATIEMLKSENAKILLQNALNSSEMNQKLRSLEDEIVELTEQLRNIEHKCSVLEAEVTNRNSMWLVNEETINSLTTELENLKHTLQERIDECTELKTRYRRRSCDGEKKVSILEAKNTELLQENGAIQAMKVAAENELKKLKNECQHMLEQQIPQLVLENQRLSSVIKDHDFKYTLLDEKNCQLASDITSLKDAEAVKKEALIKENESLQLELNSLNEKVKEQILNSVENVHLIKVQQLQKEIERLQSRENVVRTSPSSSSRIGRTSLDDDLFVKQQLLFEDRRNTPKRANVAKVERKNRRQSVHDDNRRLSVWEMHNERECQTDPVDENCACAAMNEKIVKLSRDLRIKECQMQNYEKMSKINPLQLDVEELKKALSREQKSHSETRRELNETKRLINKLELKINELQRNQIIAVHKIEISTQTQEEKNVEVSVKMEMEKLEAEYQVLEKKNGELKRLIRIRNDKIQELEQVVDNQKENYGSKVNGSNAQKEDETEIAKLKKQLMDVEEKHERLRAVSNTKVNGSVCMIEQKIQTERISLQDELEALNAQLLTINKKYDMAKRLCNLRNDDLSSLRSDLQQKSDDYETLMIKYGKVKVICQHRNEELKRYRDNEMGGRNTGLDVIIE